MMSKLAIEMIEFWVGIVVSGIVRVGLTIGLIIAGCNLSESMRAPELEKLNETAKNVGASCADVGEKIKGLSSELEQVGQKQKKLMDDGSKINAAYDDLLGKAQRLQQELDVAIRKQRELKDCSDGK